MIDAKPKKVGRWKSGGTRYNKKELEAIRNTKEDYGWRNGARVTRRAPKK